MGSSPSAYGDHTATPISVGGGVRDVNLDRPDAFDLEHERIGGLPPLHGGGQEPLGHASLAMRMRYPHL